MQASIPAYEKLLRRPPRRWNGLPVVHICWCTLGVLLHSQEQNQGCWPEGSIFPRTGAKCIDRRSLKLEPWLEYQQPLRVFTKFVLESLKCQGIHRQPSNQATFEYSLEDQGSILLKVWFPQQSYKQGFLKLGACRYAWNNLPLETMFTYRFFGSNFVILSNCYRDLLAMYRAMRVRFRYGFESCDANSPCNIKNQTLAKQRPVFSPRLPVGSQESVLKGPKQGQSHAAIRLTPKRFDSCVQGALGKQAVWRWNFAMRNC